MSRSFLRFAALSLAIVCGFTSLHAQSAVAVASSARVHTVVDVSQRQILVPGSLAPWATAENDRGSIAAGQRMDNLHLILARAPQVEAAFQQLLLDQQNSASPRFHQWLTPQQNAEQYGIAPSDLAAVENWLTSQGLQVDNVAAGGVFITFSGTAAAVQNSFGTSIHMFAHGSAITYGALSEPTVPAALAGVIRTVSGLSQEDAHIYSHVQKLDKPYHPVTGPADFQPNENFGASSHYLAPADFNTIYDVPSAGTGTGIHAVVLISSRIAAADITGFNSYFGLSAAQPTQILLPGSADPGVTPAGGEGEADLDVQRILGTAPGASVDVLVFSSLSDTLIQSALQYETSTLNDPVVNMSFGSCAAQSSPTRATTYDTYYSALAAQGVSITVSSGDSAAGACEAAFSNPVSGAVASTNVLCASQWVTCVGGTEFNDTASPSTYWGATNNASTKGSALTYIPEGAWDEPTTAQTSSGFQAAGTGGGVTAFPKPSWQTGTGVPADTFRDVPDISFSSALHVAYIVCEVDEGASGNNCATSAIAYVTLGTSAAAPSMAGIATLLNQKTGTRAGNLNPLLYQLATSTPAAFHDATPTSSGVTTCSTSTPSMCNNSDPGPTSLTGGVVGYPLTTGYDLATGLGSLDVNAFLTAAAAAGAKTSTTLALTTVTPNPVAVNGTVTLTATITRSATTAGNATGTVTFSSNGTQIGSAVTVSGNAATTTTTFSSTGTDVITAVYSGDTNYATSTATGVSLTVTAAPTFTVTPATTTYSLAAGATTGNTDVITLASVNSFAGAVVMTCTVTNTSGTAAGTCAATTPVTLTAGGTGTSTLTINTTAGTSGVLNVTVTGTNGTTVVTSSAITVNVLAPSFTVVPATTTYNLISGAVTANTDVITLTSTNTFAGAVAMTCTVTNSSGTAAGTCVATGPVTLTSGGTGTSTLTITTTPGTSGALTVTVKGTSGTTVVTSSTITVNLTASSFTVTGGAAIAIAAGATTGTSTATIASVNGFAGTVTFTCAASNPSVTNTGTTTCTASPVTLTAGGTGTSNITLTTTLGSSGATTLTITGTGTTAGATIAATAAGTVSGTVAPPSFSESAPGAININPSGATTGNTTTSTITSTQFAGTVAFTCTLTATSGSPANPATCSASSVTLTSGGTGTSTITVTSTTAHAGQAPLQLSRTGWGLRGGAAFALLLCCVPFRRRRFVRALAAFVLLACGLMAVSGCGGSGGATVKSSSDGIYTGTLTGTGTSTGAGAAFSTSATFSVTISN